MWMGGMCPDQELAGQTQGVLCLPKGLFPHQRGRLLRGGWVTTCPSPALALMAARRLEADAWSGVRNLTIAAAPGKASGLPSATGHGGTRPPHWASPSTGPSRYLAFASGPLSQADAVLDDWASSTLSRFLNGDLLFQGCRQRSWGRGLGAGGISVGITSFSHPFRSSTWGSLGTGIWRRQARWGTGLAQGPGAPLLWRSGSPTASLLLVGWGGRAGRAGTPGAQLAASWAESVPWEPGGQPPVGACWELLACVSTAFLGTRRAAPHLLPLLRASSACGGGRPSGGRAALL